MGEDALISCGCGSVKGRVANASRKRVNRAVCYCDDCQAFLQHLGRADLLDSSGGTDLVQVAPSTLTFEQGTEHIACLRLRPKGLYRHYTRCCSSPIGNVFSVGLPFVGLPAQLFSQGAGRGADHYFGPAFFAMLGKFAVGEPPPGSLRPSLRGLGRVARLILGWKLSGQTWPHPFFDSATRAPIFEQQVLSREQREALRPLCGPKSSEVASA